MKCRQTGKTFDISDTESFLIDKFEAASPLVSGFERLRSLLSFVPDAYWIKSPQYKNLTSVDERVNQGYLPHFHMSEDNSWLPYLPAFNSGEEIIRKKEIEVQYFKEEFFSLYQEYLQKQPHFSSPENNCNLYSCCNIINSADCTISKDLKNCYECIFCSASENLVYARDSHDCNSCYFIESCVGCSNCLFCSHLEDSEYCVFNSRVSEEEYSKILSKLKLDSPVHFESALERFEAFLQTQPLPENIIHQSETSSGQYIINCRNVADSFLSYNTEYSTQIFSLFDSKGTYMSAFGFDINDSYKSVMIGGNSSNNQSVYASTGNLNNVEYSIACENSSYLFGCIGLSHKQFCILNRQLSRNEYFSKKEELTKFIKEESLHNIIFSPDFCDIPYNSSMAGMLMPLGRVQAHLLGYLWDEGSDEILKKTKDQFIENGNSDSKMKICEVTGEVFEIHDELIDVCSNLNISLPERSPQQRLRDRLSKCKIGPKKEAICPITTKEISSHYSGTRPVLSMEGFTNIKS